MPDYFYVITGGPSSGKTTLIEELKKRGFSGVQDVARQTIQDEVAADGDALPWKNLERFIEKLLVRSLENYKKAIEDGQGITLFDQGLLDYVGYASRTHTKISDKLLHEAISLTYNKKVFIAPFWKEIFCNDSERKQSPKEALEVYHTLVKVYIDYDYKIIEPPKTNVETRTQFVIDHIRS